MEGRTIDAAVSTAAEITKPSAPALPEPDEPPPPPPKASGAAAPDPSAPPASGAATIADQAGDYNDDASDVRDVDLSTVHYLSGPVGVHGAEPGDLLVVNQTRVVKARLFGSKDSGGKIELLIERVLEPQLALAHIRASHAPKPGSRLHLGGGAVAEVVHVIEARTGDCLFIQRA